MIKTQGELGVIECQHNSETGKYVLENILMGLARKHAMCDTKLVFSPSCWVRTLMDKGAIRATNMSSTGVNIKSVGSLWGAWRVSVPSGGNCLLSHCLRQHPTRHSLRLLSVSGFTKLTRDVVAISTASKFPSSL